ncbi:hypothetical protein NQZ68_031330 [Dissostichus eleginoides]|nr:hypothetical protein NQZ68_031330 [Dissostichus eleginoides]
MDFDLEGFVSDPTRGKLDECNKPQLELIAGRFDIAISKHSKKQVIKEQLLAALIDQEVLSEEVGVDYFSKDEETPTMAELQLQLEMRRLAIKEKEIDGNLEIRKLEEETKRIELELATLLHRAQQLMPAQSHEFDADEYVLTHKSVFGERGSAQPRFGDNKVRESSGSANVPLQASSGYHSP